MDRLEEIKARLEAAYPGMWVWNSAGKTIESICDKWTCAIAFEMPEGSQADADFIVHAHNEDIQYLLSEIDRLTAQLDALSEAYDRQTTVHERLNKDYVELKAEVSRLTAERDAEKRRADAAEADLVLAMENSNSLMSCEPCMHRGYDPDDGLYCKLKSCKPKWRGPLPTIGGQMVQKMLDQVAPDGALHEGPEPGGEEA